MDAVLRRARADELPAIARADGRAFGMTYTEEDLAEVEPLVDLERCLLAVDPDDDRILGVTLSFELTMTVPGGGALAMPGVSWVSVAATHRRRGILRALLTEQHRGFLAEGAALSGLTASEGGIYGRFGYGPATADRTVEVDRRFAEFRAGAPDPGGVRQVEADEARPHAERVHARWCAATPGAVRRDEVLWDVLFADRPEHRRGASARFHLVHPDGYAAYRVERGDERRARIVEFVAVTDAAHAALWRVLLGLDLVRTVTATGFCPADDPLPYLLTDPRQVRTTGVADGMWLRVLDVPAALSARRYAVELDVVLDVRDPFLDSGGRVRLRGGPDGAECAPTDATADAHVDVAALGSLLLGGHRAGTLARTDLLDADGATVRRLDLAFTAERVPQHGTDF